MADQSLRYQHGPMIGHTGPLRGPANSGLGAILPGRPNRGPANNGLGAVLPSGGQRAALRAVLRARSKGRK